MTVAVVGYLSIGLAFWLACLMLGFVHQAYWCGLAKYGRRRASVAALVAFVVVVLFWPFYLVSPRGVAG